MAKKSRVTKISGTTQKKSVKKKAVTVPVSPDKAVKKKQTKKVASRGTAKRTRVTKQKSVVKPKEKTVRKQKKTEAKPKTAEKKAVAKKTVRERTPKATRKTSSKKEAPAKVDKSLKTITGKTTAKRGKEKEAKQIKKTTKKTAAKPQKKITTSRAEKPKTPKTRKLLSKKPAITVTKKKATRKIKPSEKTEQRKPLKKTVLAKKRIQKKIIDEKPVRKAADLTRASAVRPVPERKGITADTLPTGYPPPAKVSFPPVRIEALPSEYGENVITLMPVNPFTLFAFWEVSNDTLNIFKGALNLRVYDVTGIDFNTTDAHSFIDKAVSERVGKIYLDVGPAKEYIADIGILYNGIFIGIARSTRVFTPNAGVPGEEEFLPEGFDIGIRLGY